MKKKLVCILLTLVMVLAMIPMTTGVASAFSLGGDITVINMGPNSYGLYYQNTRVTGLDNTVLDLASGINYISNDHLNYVEYVTGSTPTFNLHIHDVTITNTYSGSFGIMASNGIVLNVYLSGTNNITADYGIVAKNVIVESGTTEITAKKIGVYADEDIEVKSGASISVTITGDQDNKDYLTSAVDTTLNAPLSVFNKNYFKQGSEFISGADLSFGDNCIEAAKVTTSGSSSDLYCLAIDLIEGYVSILNTQTPHVFVAKSNGTSQNPATDCIIAKNVNTKVTLLGGKTYPETWEPYYETLALKIAAQAEIEAQKMLEEAKVTVKEEPVVDEKVNLVASSEETIAPNGKNSVKVTWKYSNDKALEFEGYDVYRAGVDGEYKFMFNTKNDYYYNTLIRAGQKYSYKVKGYNTVDGEKVYSDFSTETACVVK